MRSVLIIIALLFIAGCAMTVNKALDAARKPLVNELIEYCKAPEYRREALSLLINGSLRDLGISINITCASDDENSRIQG